MASVGTTGRRTARQAEAAGEDVARSRQLEWLARAGLAARGVVYGLIRILAIKVAFGAGAALWRFGRAAIAHGPETVQDCPNDRISGVLSGIAYAALSVTAVKILI